jgi:hypothetical protein
MTGRSSHLTGRGGRGGGYRPGTLSFANPMAPVPEGTNENGPTEIDNPISLRMEFSLTAENTIRKVLSSFLDALSQADELATLYNTKQTQFYQTSKDLPKDVDILRSHFPVRQLQRGQRTIAILRVTLSSRSNLTTLRTNGLASWASTEKLKLEADVFLTANVKDVVWFLRKNQYTSKPHLHRYLTQKITKHSFNEDEEDELKRLHSDLTFTEIPPFALYLRRRYRIDSSETTCVILRTDAVAANFFEMLLRNMNDSMEISPNDMVIVPLKLARTDRPKAIACVREQNKFLDETTSLPLVGISFEALDYKIQVLIDEDTHAETSEPISVRDLIGRHVLSVEPTSKSDSLGRFNVIVHKRKLDMAKAYLQTELPAIWHELPEAIRSKFAAKRIPYPRLTKGQDIGSSMSVMTSLSDLSSIDPRTGAVTNKWDKPPNLNPKPPTNIDALYSTHLARDVDLSLIPQPARPNATIATDASSLTSQQTLAEQLLARNRILEQETDSQATQIKQLTTDLASIRITLQEVMAAFSTIQDRLPPVAASIPPPLDSDSSSKRARQGSTPTRNPPHQLSRPSPPTETDELSVRPMVLDEATHAADSTLHSQWPLPDFSTGPPTPSSPPQVQKTVHEGDAFHDSVTQENVRS